MSKVTSYGYLLMILTCLMIIGTQASATVISSQYQINDLLSNSDRAYEVALNDTDQSNLQSGIDWAALTFHFDDDEDGFSLFNINGHWRYNTRHAEYQKLAFDFRIDNERESVTVGLGDHHFEHISHRASKLSLESETKQVNNDTAGTAYTLQITSGFIADFSSQIALTSEDISRILSAGVISFDTTVIGDLYLTGFELSYQLKDKAYAAPEPSSVILMVISLIGLGIARKRVEKQIKG